MKTRLVLTVVVELESSEGYDYHEGDWEQLRLNDCCACEQSCRGQVHAIDVLRCKGPSRLVRV